MQIFCEKINTQVEITKMNFQSSVHHDQYFTIYQHGSDQGITEARL